MNIRKLLGITAGLLVSVVLAYVVFGMIQGKFIRANDEVPQDVRIVNVTGTTATISWKTPIEADGGVIQYGVSPASLGSFAPIEGDKSKNHSVDLSLLTPATTYYFQIVYGESRVYDNGGAPWSFVTKGDDVSGQGEGINLQTNPSSTSIQVAPAATTQSAAPTAVPAPATSTTSSCNYSSCAEIKQNLGHGCSTQEYMQCVRK